MDPGLEANATTNTSLTKKQLLGRALTEEELIVQETLRIIMFDNEVAIRELKDDMISFYMVGKADLDIKEFTIEECIETFCKFWAKAKCVTPFIDWDSPTFTLFKRINKVGRYDSYKELLDEGRRYKSKHNSAVTPIVPEWNMTFYEGLTYIIEEKRKGKL